MKAILNSLKITLGVILLMAVFSFSAKASQRLTDTTVYVHLETGPDTYHLNDDWDYHEVYDFYIRFYSNPGCTVPFTLTSDMTVEMQANFTLTLWNSNVYTSGGSGYAYGAMGDNQIELGDRYVRLVMNDPYQDNRGSYYLTGNTTGGTSTLHYQIIP